jgi:LysR substrate binding domain
MLCILSEQHPLHKQEKISFEQIQEEHLIMPKEGWDHDIKQILRDNNIKPNVKFEVPDDRAIYLINNPFIRGSVSLFPFFPHYGLRYKIM